MSVEEKFKDLAEEVFERLDQLEALLLTKYEKAAERKAIDAEFGVSEWRSFMPQEWHDVVGCRTILADSMPYEWRDHIARRAALEASTQEPAKP